MPSILDLLPSVLNPQQTIFLIILFIILIVADNDIARAGIEEFLDQDPICFEFNSDRSIGLGGNFGMELLN
jgi:hypothetical protein